MAEEGHAVYLVRHVGARVLMTRRECMHCLVPHLDVTTMPRILWLALDV